MLRRSVGALLLLIQGLAGGATAWADSAPLPTASAALEASHDEQCLVLHNELLCPLCQYVGTVGLPTSREAVEVHGAVPMPLAHAPLFGHTTVADHFSHPPRAPPRLLA